MINKAKFVDKLSSLKSMSIQSIHQYQQELEKIIHFGGTKKETAIRNAFYVLLNDYAKQKGLIMVPEVTIKAANGKSVTPDGTLKDSLRQDWGYWESKDESDDLDEEIKKKFAKGYPKENILFEDSRIVILIQNGVEQIRASMKDAEALHRTITTFVNFERPEVLHFRKAIELFKQDIPKVTQTLRILIIEQENTNSKFIKASTTFLKLCHDSINPEITNEDVREMIIQHILTEDVFNTIFDENQFHRENNIARELESVINTFFTGATRKTALGTVQHYYQAINAAAAGIADHHEKQKFLKVIYETFYKSYNPKAADRLGVVYTPNEVVQFMIKNTDYLLNKHFNKFLEDKGVEILDPATGTGTFICDIIDYISRDKLSYKYKNELHANEIAILPYYISNLNIEFTYTQKMGSYSEFENLCFVDTLDNMGFAYRGKQIDMFSPFTEENTIRIKKQNDKKIAIIIGNPPYNANQLNENDNNKNREYQEIDKRIKETYIKYSVAQKTKQYDMYKRFFRWSSDRLNENGILSFITNRAYIDSRQDDGFRKSIQDEFDYAYIIDTKSDVRANPKIAGTTHNIFGIQTGVSIIFLVKKSSKIKKGPCVIYYSEMQDEWRKEIKLQWLAENALSNINFVHIQPDKNNNWIDISDNDFDHLLPLINTSNPKKQLFELISNGVNTARDEWVFDLDVDNLINKVTYLNKIFGLQIDSGKIADDQLDYTIKWSDALKAALKKGDKIIIESSKVINYLYRPFFNVNYYSEKKFSDRLTSNHYQMFGKNLSDKNHVIAFSGRGSSKDFSVLATSRLFSFDLLEKTQSLPLYARTLDGLPAENVTDWGLNQFTKRYNTKRITKEQIFHYVYAVLHCPAYKLKYETNLKRELPRIPFYDDFKQWAEWGKRLMDLHINYESVQPFKLRVVVNIPGVNKTMLKVSKEAGIIMLDGNTALMDIPPEAWNYKLGNRSALEWVLDQYKVGKPKDQTIADKFSTYDFANYKSRVIDLLKRVCTVSVETSKIVAAMSQAQPK